MRHIWTTPQQKQEPPCLSAEILGWWRALQRAGELQFAASQALDHRYCDFSTVSPACTGLLSMYAAIRSNSRTPSPNDRRIPAAKTACRFGPACGWRLEPSCLSAIGAHDRPAPEDETKRERDCSSPQTRADRKIPNPDPGAALRRPGPQPPAAAETPAPTGWCPDSGPSTQKLFRPNAYPEEDIAREADFHAGAM